VGSLTSHKQASTACYRDSFTYIHDEELWPWKKGIVRFNGCTKLFLPQPLFRESKMDSGMPSACIARICSSLAPEYPDGVCAYSVFKSISIICRCPCKPPPQKKMDRRCPQWIWFSFRYFWSYIPKLHCTRDIFTKTTVFALRAQTVNDDNVETYFTDRKGFGCYSVLLKQ
jgi:hypothetical protein